MGVLSDVSPLAAILLITAAFALVGGLIVLGLRQRPTLEIPPRPWPEPVPMSPQQRRLHFGLFLGGWMCWLGALVGAVADIRWLVLVGWSLFLAVYAVRLFMNVRRAIKARRSRPPLAR
jgi:hypothetical protein